MKTNEQSIESLLPHAGRMVLIGELLDHDASRLSCRAQTGPLAHHPLARKGRLPATALAEYGAQAMAIHGSLLHTGTVAREGRLVALSDLELRLAELDHSIELLIEVERIGGSDNGELYTFQVASGADVLATGRATVMFVDQEAHREKP